MVKIIVLNGLAGSGKSLFAEYCTSYMKKNPNTVFIRELSSVDFVKKIARLCGWDGTKDEKSRIFLHQLKTILTEWNDVPNKECLDVINKIQKANPSYNDFLFFVNIREPECIRDFEELCHNSGYDDVTRLLVVRDENAHNEVPEIAEYINAMNYDYFIVNNGTQEALKTEALKFVENLFYKN